MLYRYRKHGVCVPICERVIVINHRCISSRWIGAISTAIESIKRLFKESTNSVNDDNRIRRKDSTLRTRNCALLLMYAGSGYRGMCRAIGYNTVEEELLGALLKSRLIDNEMFAKPQLLRFQRASRTDKFVSAANQVVSLEIPFDDNITTTLNQILPKDIRILDCFPVTTKFVAQFWVDSRVYVYLAPSLAFAPGELTDEEELRKFRLSHEDVSRINRLLQNYVGTKNLHNFTSQRKSSDRSCYRYNSHLKCSEPFVREGLEFVQISITGQSFMQHQIRKMVGMVVSIMGDIHDENIFSQVFKPEKVHVPKAPGLGLILHSLDYSHYNNRFKRNRKAIDWSNYETTIEDFKKRVILPHIYRTESEENAMMKWRQALYNFRWRPEDFSDHATVSVVCDEPDGHFRRDETQDDRIKTSK